MEIEISRLFTPGEFAPMDYSASVAEIGEGAGRATWRAACDDSAEFMFLDTPKKREAMRDHVRGFGAWDQAEIAAWSDLELNALFLQMVAGDIRESALDGKPGVIANTRAAWREYQKHAEAGRIGGAMFRADNGAIFYYLGE